MKSIRSHAILFFMTLLFSTVVSGKMIERSKLWLNGFFIGPLQNSKRVDYYLEPRLEFMDDKYKFEEAYVYAGIGYLTLPHLFLFVGIAPEVAKHAGGSVSQELRFWQMAQWEVSRFNVFNLLDRTWLEERKNLAEPQISYRLRNRPVLRIPLKNWEYYSVVLFDEVYFNLNRVRWVNSNTFEQNRAFIGIGRQFSTHTILDVGYLNQYQLTIPNHQMSNILFISLNVICD